MSTTYGLRRALLLNRNGVAVRFEDRALSFAELADRVARCVADGLETYAFFKHEEDPRSPLNAVELLTTVRTKASGKS